MRLAALRTKDLAFLISISCAVVPPARITIDEVRNEMSVSGMSPTMRHLRLPILALSGELDNNILADKNRAASDAALRATRNRDHTLTVMPKANHCQWQAEVGNNVAKPSLQGFVPAYFTTIQNWLATRIRGLRA
jgi:hypothetical protein